MKFTLYLIILFFNINLLSAEVLKKIAIKIKNQELKVELAESNEQKAQGLMFRKTLQENQGMLFVFDPPERMKFWMKNTFIPLSLAFVDKKKVIQDLYDLNAVSSEMDTQIPSYQTKCICSYVLEVNQGWFLKNKIKIGDVLQFHLPEKEKNKKNLSKK